MVDWGSLLRLLASLGAFFGEQKLAERHPLAPWQAVNSSAWIQVEAPTALDSMPIWVRAPEVDGAQRFLGWAHRGGDNFFRSPYADTKVYVTSDITIRAIVIDGPGVYTVRF